MLSKLNPKIDIDCFHMLTRLAVLHLMIKRDERLAKEEDRNPFKFRILIDSNGKLNIKSSEYDLFGLDKNFYQDSTQLNLLGTHLNEAIRLFPPNQNEQLKKIYEVAVLALNYLQSRTSNPEGFIQVGINAFSQAISGEKEPSKTYVSLNLEAGKEHIDQVIKTIWDEKQITAVHALIESQDENTLRDLLNRKINDFKTRLASSIAKHP